MSRAHGLGLRTYTFFYGRFPLLENWGRTFRGCVNVILISRIVPFYLLLDIELAEQIYTNVTKLKLERALLILN